MMGDWTFFSNYGHVLVCLARNREVRLRDVAQEVGITERAVQKIVRDLQEAGFLTVTKQGRCNRYLINKRKSLRHGLESHCTVGKLLALVARVPQSPASITRAGKAADTGLTEDKAQEPVEVVEEPARKKKSAKKEPGSADTRQQGSLF